MANFNSRDRSRTYDSKIMQQVQKNTRPPSDEGGWFAISAELLASPSVRSLSLNAKKVLERLILEHISHGRRNNGDLIVTHTQLIQHGVTAQYVRDATDELKFKGLIKVRRGKAGDGTAHPNRYTLTFTGTCDGLAATNEWKKLPQERIDSWSEERNRHKSRTARLGRKKNPR